MKGPIFIIGCPRSGTTMTLRLMANQGQVAWISNYLNDNPQQTGLAALNRIYDAPVAGRRMYLRAIQGNGPGAERIRRRLPHPVEPWVFWNHYLSKFQWPREGATPPRRRTADDISEAEIEVTKQAVRAMLQAAGKGRLLSKYTDFPRMTYLRQVFPDARFIHVVRDGRAVAASYLDMIKKGKFGTWDERKWWISGWPEEWQRRWRDGPADEAAFVATQWKFFVRLIRMEMKEIPADQYAEINYRDIVSSTKQTMERILSFCGLELSQVLLWQMERMTLVDMNHKWRKRFTDAEQQTVEAIVREPEFGELLDD